MKRGVHMHRNITSLINTARNLDVPATPVERRLRDLEQFVHDTGLRGRAAIAAFNSRPLKDDGDKLLWSGDPDSTKNFIAHLERNIDECRIARGARPIYGR